MIEMTMWSFKPLNKIWENCISWFFLWLFFTGILLIWMECILLFVILPFLEPLGKFPSVLDNMWGYECGNDCHGSHHRQYVGFAAPTSIPPLATTSAISPPDDDSPTAVRVEVMLLIPSIWRRHRLRKQQKYSTSNETIIKFS